MSRRSKIPPEEKMKAVQDFLAGRLCQSKFVQIYGIGSQRLYEWVRVYKIRGSEGLIPTIKNRKYTPETKRMAVEEYLSGIGSLSDLCTKYDISNHAMLQAWIKRYNDYGYFKQPNNGGAIYMVKGRKTTYNERIEIVSHCIANNKDYGKTIDQYGVSYQQIYVWVKKYEQDGCEGLADRRGKRKEEAFMTEVEKLRAQLKLQKAENLRLQMDNDLLKKLEELERGRNAD